LLLPQSVLPQAHSEGGDRIEAARALRDTGPISGDMEQATLENSGDRNGKKNYAHHGVATGNNHSRGKGRSMIAYFRGKSFVSKVIRWRTWGKYSHVAWIVGREVAFADDLGRRVVIPAGTIYESWHKKDKGAPRNGVRKGFAGGLHKPGTPIDLYRVKITDLHHEHLIRTLEDKLKDPNAAYDWRAVISGFALRKRKANSASRLFCSELLMDAFRRIAYRFLINIAPEQTSPADMSHSPVQQFVATWHTDNAFPDFSLPEGWR
jgi:hypothetical protein